MKKTQGFINFFVDILCDAMFPFILFVNVC